MIGVKLNLEKGEGPAFSKAICILGDGTKNIWRWQVAVGVGVPE